MSNELDQVHVPRWIKEMNAAKSRSQRRRASLRECANRKPRGVGREGGMGSDVRGDLIEQRALPIHALGDRLDDQIAIRQLGEMLVIIARIDVSRLVSGRAGRWLELREILDRSLYNAVRIAVLASQIEKNDRNIGIGEMRCNLRAHDARTQYCGFANEKAWIGHGGLPNQNMG